MCAESLTFSTPAKMVKEKSASAMKTQRSICPARAANAATATTPTLVSLMALRCATLSGVKPYSISMRFAERSSIASAIGSIAAFSRP